MFCDYLVQNAILIIIWIAILSYLIWEMQQKSVEEIRKSGIPIISAFFGDSFINGWLGVVGFAFLIVMGLVEKLKPISILLRIIGIDTCE